MTSLVSNSKLCKFITLLKLIKTPKSFVETFFSIKSINIDKKTKGEVLAAGLL